MLIRKSIIIFTMSALFTAGSFLISQYEPTSYAQVNQQAPDFNLSDIYGNPLSLSDFKGKVVLLDFWATWCPYCRASIPILKSLYHDYKDEGLEVIGIAIEQDGGKRLRRFAKEENIDYPLAVGEEGLVINYSAYGVPTRFLINRQGEIVGKFIGFQGRKVLEKAIKELLK